MIKYFKYNFNEIRERFFHPETGYIFTYYGIPGRIYEYDSDYPNEPLRKWGRFCFWDNDYDNPTYEDNNWRILKNMGIIEEITKEEFNNRMLIKKLKL